MCTNYVQYILLVDLVDGGIEKKSFEYFNYC